tara:strand:- start:441 stop:1505 length:1065 start_codon:yes stop_codon:yes gene_type:complete
MAYTAANKHTDYFNTVLYTGTDAAKSVTGVGFQPDFTWIKTRSHGGTAFPHILTDAVRGVNKTLFTNTNDAETTNYTNGYLSAFGTDGFTVTGQDAVSGIGRTYVGWNWKAGTTGSGTTTGSGYGKAYSYSVNTTAGFSIVKYVGNGTSGHQIPHHLGAVPTLAIIKKTDGTENWVYQSADLGWGNRLYLDTTNTSASHTDFISSVSSTTFSLYTNGSVNSNDANYIAYIFTDIPGFSQHGIYRGNGDDDGTFIPLSFKPAFVLGKNTEQGSDDWHIYDNKRSDSDGGNILYKRLHPNSNGAETTTQNMGLDFYSNGFKITDNLGAINNFNEFMVYMAFGQSLVGSNNIPCTAR